MQGRCWIHAVRLAGSNPKWVLRKAQPNATLDAIVQGMPVELIESFGCKRDVFKLHKTHGAVMLRPKAQSFVASLFGEHGLELILGRI